MALHPAVSQSLLVPRPTRWGRFLLFSLGAHILAVLVAFCAALLQRPPSVDLNQKPIRASLVRLGKPRDPKLLPRKEEPPPPPPKAVEAPAPAPATAPEPPKVAVPVPSTQPAPSAPQKVAGDKNAVDRRKQLLSAFNKTSKAAPQEELEGAADGDPSGDSSTAEGERYYGVLSSLVRRYYDVSSTIDEGERLRLKAHVVLRIGKAGELLTVKLANPSGNDLFDSAVLAAVKKAAPFPPPPDALRTVLANSGVTFSFKP